MKYDKKKWIYHNDLDDKIRYILGTRGNKTLLCFGINPSTAKPDELDNTLKSVQRRAIKEKYDSWIMLNIYPQREKESDKIHKEFDPTIHKKNLRFIEKLLSRNNFDIWAAWGNIIETRPFLFKCLYDIYSLSLNYKCSWYHIGDLTKRGHPHHPLYLKKESEKNKFNIGDYLQNHFKD